GSNHTIECILLKSPLVQVYHNLCAMFKRNFMHMHLTSQHAEVNMNMAKMFHEVCKHLSELSPHTVQTGQKSKYMIPNLTSQG
ncbi:hypothetical protein BS17DRAFT_680599, partial [Gyrodon lividus]